MVFTHWVKGKAVKSIHFHLINVKIGVDKINNSGVEGLNYDR